MDFYQIITLLFSFLGLMNGLFAELERKPYETNTDTEAAIYGTCEVVSRERRGR